MPFSWSAFLGASCWNVWIKVRTGRAVYHSLMTYTTVLRASFQFIIHSGQGRRLVRLRTSIFSRTTYPGCPQSEAPRYCIKLDYIIGNSAQSISRGISAQAVREQINRGSQTCIHTSCPIASPHRDGHGMAFLGRWPVLMRLSSNNRSLS